MPEWKMRSKFYRSCWGQIAVLEISMFEFVVGSVTWERHDITVTNGGIHIYSYAWIYFKIRNATEY